MRSLDFNTRSQITREAISRVCEAVPGAKGAFRKRKPPSKALSSILGKSNLQFAGMSITLNISTSSLNLMTPDSKQIIANHHMQSISFASGGDPDTTDYVAYVAKDPVNRRACHILECCDGLAQDVISTIGQAFELRFRQYLQCPSKLPMLHDREKSGHFNTGCWQRWSLIAWKATWHCSVHWTVSGASFRVRSVRGMLNVDESPWTEEEEETAEHPYYNNIPGKMPPPGGFIDARLKNQPSAQSEGPQVYQTYYQGRHFGESRSEDRKPAPVRQAKITLTWKTTTLSPPLSKTWTFCALLSPVSPVSLSTSSRFPDLLPLSIPCPLSTGDPQGPVLGLLLVFLLDVCSCLEPFEDAIRNQTQGPVLTFNVSEELNSQLWYHREMSRKEAEQVLKEDGDFLVRKSTTNPGSYVLTGMHNGQAKHLLLVDPEGTVRTKDHVFDSISHLISHHRDNSLPIVSAGSELCLKQPVARKQ
ncbi:SHC3 protein, partial [Amia calva]|nr:SHC3 protein [Amia calva]